jgi:hypothetical protein
LEYQKFLWEQFTEISHMRLPQVEFTFSDCTRGWWGKHGIPLAKATYFSMKE